MLALVGLAFCSPPILAAEGDSAEQQVNRGAYLVHRVAMCVECHSPRSADGKLIASKLLSGGRIPVSRPYRNVDWALKAPRLAGLPGFDAQEVVQLLTEGKRAGGYAPRSPMPAFRLERADAEAIVEYLLSIEP